MTRTALTLALALLAAPAFAQVMEKDGILTDANGMTLYTFDKDEGGKSACYDQCAENWPPLIAAADAKEEGEYGLVERTDGTKQWTHEGMPLYLWVQDQNPGDRTGDGVNGVWHTAKD